MQKKKKKNHKCSLDKTKQNKCHPKPFALLSSRILCLEAVCAPVSVTIDLTLAPKTIGIIHAKIFLKKTHTKHEAFKRIWIVICCNLTFGSFMHSGFLNPKPTLISYTYRCGTAHILHWLWPTFCMIHTQIHLYEWGKRSLHITCSFVLYFLRFAQNVI